LKYHNARLGAAMAASKAVQTAKEKQRITKERKAYATD
jgi:hypothetical protein